MTLSACTVGPDYHRPLAPVPAQYKEARPQPGWKFGQPSDAINRGAWWSIYNDPVLDGLEKRIDISNQNLKAAAAALRQAEEIVAEARAGFFPAATVELAAQRTRASGANGTAGPGERPDNGSLQRRGCGQLGARFLGEYPPHRRGRCRHRPGERRRSRECAAVGTGDAGRRLSAAADRR